MEVEDEKTELLLGADPEVFVRSGHMLVSGHTFTKGTKEDPEKTSHGTVQADGLALEFNIVPASERSKFVGHIVQMKQDLRKLVAEREPYASLEFIPAARFGKGYFKTLPDHVKELGCSVDFNAYTMDYNPRPKADDNIRVAGGHIHLGWTHDQDVSDVGFLVECASIARQLDFYLGLPSLKWDQDRLRRQRYGKAGSFRPKPYGLEYRVLSNVWTRSVNTCGFVFDNATRAFRSWNAGHRLEDDFKRTAQIYIDHCTVEWPSMEPELAEEVNYAGA